MITKKEIYLIIVFVAITSLVSYLGAGFIFKTRVLSSKVETVEAINSEFPSPDKTYFNDQALNPTQLIKIGETNPRPFNPGSQDGQ